MEETMINSVLDKAKIQADQARIKAAGSKATQQTRNNAAVDKAAEDFEAVFLAQMLQHMFKGVDPDPMTDGPGEDIYQSMMIDEYGKILARSGGIGVADHVKREMLKLQETSQ